ncbi:hypothetical protein ASPSYDRAFT_737331 [Aspergillus sydowii CBS 593.65]|uniref:Uncharacterized protein n=1 Tax=Aspergillus sydowii CBS 593.65 TaxID=1036612 RepID=A0A1L9TM90_9EURO|nr:uncharacterized protein ASPSYDRAFT_737331 [Aspergillus sydowii CBS 593.65]OJJ60511.1 hypothetical protein ASPSYDRAFT_737331 [Aspergillus sydowii CBS 593.65]
MKHEIESRNGPVPWMERKPKITVWLLDVRLNSLEFPVLARSHFPLPPLTPSSQVPTVQLSPLYAAMGRRLVRCHDRPFRPVIPPTPVAKLADSHCWPCRRSLSLCGESPATRLRCSAADYFRSLRYYLIGVEFSLPPLAVSFADGRRKIHRCRSCDALTPVGGHQAGHQATVLPIPTDSKAGSPTRLKNTLQPKFRLLPQICVRAILFWLFSFLGDTLGFRILAAAQPPTRLA